MMHSKMNRKNTGFDAKIMHASIIVLLLYSGASNRQITRKVRDPIDLDRLWTEPPARGLLPQASGM